MNADINTLDVLVRVMEPIEVGTALHAVVHFLHLELVVRRIIQVYSEKRIEIEDGGHTDVKQVNVAACAHLRLKSVSRRFVCEPYALSRVIGRIALNRDGRRVAVGIVIGVANDDGRRRAVQVAAGFGNFRKK
jgi:translation elongation factor EF-1alpha